MVRRLSFLFAIMLISLLGLSVLTSSGRAESANLVDRLQKRIGRFSLMARPDVNPSTTTSSSLRVLSWNIQFGEGTDAIKDFDRTASWIARANPDLAALCEIPPDDVPTLVNSLIQKTGRVWYAHFVPKFPGCLEGNLILSKHPLISVNLLFMSYNRSVAEATINLGGKNVNFFATHLDDGSSANRYAEVGEMTDWAAGFAGIRIFAGDFNAGPDTPEVGRMLNSYYDAWARAMDMGSASAYPDNPVWMHTRTRRGRIDQVFYSPDAANLILSSSQIPDIRDLSNTNVVDRLGTLDDNGVRPSDHNQMIADFVIPDGSPSGTPTPTPTPTPTATPTPAPVASNVQFSASAYSGSEGSLSIGITVTRTGDTSGSVTVDYFSEDGSAQQRTDYITAAGTITFAPGEQSKSFVVLINDDSYVEGDEAFIIRLTDPSGGAVLGSPSSATLTIIDDDSSTPGTNPLDNPISFVRQHYYDFLSRQPDPSGLGYWVSQLTDCGAVLSCLNSRRVTVSDAFFFEPEFQKTAAYVFRLYRLAYGNNQPWPNPDLSDPTEARKLPSYAAFVSDRAWVVDGANLAQSQKDLANEFVNRNEFWTRYPAALDAAAFVAAVLTTIRSSSGVDLSSQAGVLTTLCNDYGRGAVLYRLADDNVQGNPIDNRAFIDAEYNRAFVMTEYAGFLRRDSDIAGYLFWLDQVNRFPLRNATVQHSLVCSFITSREYQERFSSTVTHSNAECGQ